MPARRHRRRRDTSYETSAGGMAVRTIDGAPAVAIIGRRRGRLRWSLPKGHVEAGESLEQAAVREVREETGISASVLRRLGTMEYTFTEAGQRIHKTVHHFLMRAVSGELSDEDPEVSEVAWVALDELPGRLAYPAERRLARRAQRLWRESGTGG